MNDASRDRVSSTRPKGPLDQLRVFEQAPGFVCFLEGPDFVFELANEAYLQLVGHRDVLGKGVMDALPEIAGQGFLELLQRVYATGEPFVGHGTPIKLQQHPGAPLSEAFLDFIYQPIRGDEGEVIGILVQGNDVTELKRVEAERAAAEAALRASEERYRTLFDSIDDGFCLMQMILDARGKTVDYRFLEANRAFESHTGLVNALGKTARELVPDLDDSWFELYGRVADTGEPARFENHAPAMNRWFDVYANRVGRPEQRYVALVFKDVSERKRSERERDQLLASESRARAQAELASQLKDEFLATLSHELRTPLHSMLGWISLLRIGSLSQEKRERALETIERNAHSQAQLIEDLLDVSAIMAGKLRLEVLPLDVRAAVEAALDTVRPAADAKGIRLQATLASGCSVMGDAARLQQIVWNLLSNAVKFTPKGGRVQVLLECRDSSAEITVADTGQGIPAEFLPHVFERFRQQDGGSTRRQGGLGLGLSIVRQLVELHGGTVAAFSDGLGSGSSFSVKLPQAIVKRRDSGPEPLTDAGLRSDRFGCPPEMHGLDVLIVDDEEDAREMLRATLEACGVQVRAAAGAADCLRQLAEKCPDLLVSDIGMPELDGYGLIERVRALSREAGGQVPAVALTAYARAEDRTRALLAGFNGHLPKPVDPVELLAVVASLSGRVSAQRP